MAELSREPGPLPRGFPLVETHLHFEGSIPVRVLARLAARAGRVLTGGGPREGRGLQRRRGFGPFLDAFVFCASLLRTTEDVEEAASALLDDLRAEGFVYVEILFSPQVHLRRGLSLAALLGGLAMARRRALAGGGPAAGFIADGGRLWGAPWFEEIVDQIIAFRKSGVVAIGLGGDERAAKAGWFRASFERARRAGLGTVAHAGEGTGPRAVREAIDDLGVTRVGHGIAAAADPSLLRLLARRGIVLEICPTSNLMTGAVRSLASHPLRRILDAGVNVAIGSDDRTIFGTTLRGELDLAVRRLGAPRSAIPGFLVNAARSSFTSARSRRDLVGRVAAAVPKERSSPAACP